MPRSWPPTISAVRSTGNASRAARVGSTLVDRLSSMNVTPSITATVASRRAQFVVAGLLDRQRPQALPGDERVAAVVLSPQSQWLHPVRARLVGRAPPFDNRAQFRPAAAEQVAVTVGDGEFGARLGAQRQLVPV